MRNSKPRKEELLKELQAIEKREMAKKLEELKDVEGSMEAKIRMQEATAHDSVLYVDLLIKLAMAIAIGGAFFFTIYEGVINGSVGAKASVHFQMISVLGPLFGAVLQYYFGKNKAGANGE